MSETTLKAEAWTLFDRIVARAAGSDGRTYSIPWRADADGDEPVYQPDYSVLEQLLGVPLLLGAASQSGVPALALDVWTAYELRRVGFQPDLVWPRATPPRILPSTLVALLKDATRPQREALEGMLRSGKTYGNETGASANILGKNYVKQVDVVMSAWNTGPEIMISTKRMDSSFGKNAANRVEESYGDAKNLRSRHPQAALGFLYSLRSTALMPQSADIAAWIIDLLGKLGREDDAYDAVCLVIPDWPDGLPPPPGEDEDDEDPLVSAGVQPGRTDDAEPLPLALPEDELDRRLRDLPQVGLRRDAVPTNLSPEVFFATIVNRVLDDSPINFHRLARQRRAEPAD
ncbi:hypothetical protein [Geodermatophilus sp. DSM 45219]|uniref:hypothetical protein n=1 Tax=Geodermatophilus sp. DSM 45219 TaxID=1881103 RepID=UPI0008811689|nr:hypothetical protein [Geodermatophilus sp. DSM 45219]SDN38519.1 hypothetical protein SAMN05428965_0147 [Geodermatophilus sp. DSM 45219]